LPGGEVDFAAGEEEAFDAVGVADTDLDVGFFVDGGAFECGAAFDESAAGGVEDFVGGVAIQGDVGSGRCRI
jgi:hypothetical protein